MRLSSKVVAIIAVIFPVLFATAAQACTVCMGDPSSKAAEGANGAIFLMLGFVAVMLSSIGGFIFYLARRAKTADPLESVFSP